MATEILSVTSSEDYRSNISKAARMLRDGGLIAFPTETVYGVAASAEVADAVQRLRNVKGRNTNEPLTVHLGCKSQAELFANGLSPIARHLVAHAWPGPLTLILEVPEPQRTSVVAGKDPGFGERIFADGTIGLRCPDCPAALDVISEADCVVVASSANRKGRNPPTNADQVIAELDGEVAFLLDGGPTTYKAPSSIVRVRGHELEVVREGVLNERTIRRLATRNILLVCTGNTCRSPMAEGMLKSMLAQKLGCRIDELPQYGLNVTSAGTMGVDGAPATPEAVQAMADVNVDINEHRSRGLSKDVVNSAQLILAMTHWHRDMIRNMAPDAASRTRLLAEDANIEDPIGGDLQRYVACRQQITAGLEAHLAEIIP